MAEGKSRNPQAAAENLNPHNHVLLLHYLSALISRLASTKWQTRSSRATWQNNKLKIAKPKRRPNKVTLATFHSISTSQYGYAAAGPQLLNPTMYHSSATSTLSSHLHHPIPILLLFLSLINFSISFKWTHLCHKF